MFGETHAACATTEQTPNGVQQAPVGCGHGFGEQTLATPCHTLGAAHAASSRTVHVPSKAQQAPAGRQGFGEQLVSAPW